MGARKPVNKTKLVDNVQGWLSVLPAIILICVLMVYPIVYSILKSFTNWDGLFRSDYVGLRNYIRILGRGQFWMLLSNNVILLIFIPIQLVLGLLVAMFLFEEVPGWKFYRSCFYLPQVLSALSVGYLFAVFFGYDGPINQIISVLGGDPVYWLGNRWTALLVIIICLVWINIGWQGMLFMGSMSQISSTVFEAARIDGAGFWTRMFKIMLPMMMRTVEYSCIMSVLWVFTGLYNLIYSITSGGPGYGTTTVDYMIYVKAFAKSSEFGYACALSVILMIIVTAVTLVQMRISNRVSD